MPKKRTSKTFCADVTVLTALMKNLLAIANKFTDRRVLMSGIDGNRYSALARQLILLSNAASIVWAGV